MPRDSPVLATTGTVRRSSPQPSAPRTLAPGPNPPCLSHSPSVHYLCKPHNPDPNARHHPRAQPPPTPVTPPSTRAPLPTVRAGPSPEAIPAPPALLATSPVKAQQPGPAPRVPRRQRVPRPRQPAEPQPRTPIRLFLPRPVGEGWGEGLPVEAPRVAPVVSAHRERPPNPAKTPPAAPQEFLGRNSSCARDTPKRTPSDTPPLQPLHPVRPTAAESRPSQVRHFLPRLWERLGACSSLSRGAIRGTRPGGEGLLSPIRLLLPRPVGEGWGEGPPVETPRVTPVVSAHRKRPPSPANTPPAAPQEFLRRNSYCARGAPFPPNRRCRCRLSLRSTVTPESRS